MYLYDTIYIYILYVMWLKTCFRYIFVGVWWSLSHQVLDAGEQLPERPGTGWAVIFSLLKYPGFEWWWVQYWFTMVQYRSLLFTFCIRYDQSSHWKAFRMLRPRFQWLGVACLIQLEIWNGVLTHECWTSLNRYFTNVYTWIKHD